MLIFVSATLKEKRRRWHGKSETYNKWRSIWAAAQNKSNQVDYLREAQDFHIRKLSRFISLNGIKCRALPSLVFFSYLPTLKNCFRTFLSDEKEKLNHKNLRKTNETQLYQLIKLHCLLQVSGETHCELILIRVDSKFLSDFIRSHGESFYWSFPMKSKSEALPWNNGILATLQSNRDKSIVKIILPSFSSSPGKQKFIA